MSRAAARPAARAAWGVKLVLSRPAEKPEIDRLVRCSRQESASYRAARRAGAAELAAWTMVANVLLNLDEAMTKE